MNKRLLVAVSDDPSVYFGLRFISRFFSEREHLQITIMHMVRQAPKVWGDEDAELLAMRENLVRTYEQRGREVIESARSLFRYEGFADENLQSKYLVRRFSRPRELLLEGEEGDYDALVLGRRGIRRIEDMLSQDTCTEILQEPFPLPVWICRRPDIVRKEVLLCTDGSEPSLRMAEHVAAMTAEESRHRICVLHVCQSEKDRETGRRVVERTEDVLADGGMPRERIFGRLEVSGEIPRTIMRRAEAGNFAVVACGRVGAGKGALKRLLLGSVTDDLFQHLTGAVLWLSR